ncbi:AAA family ATPase [Marinobacter sp. X15-166B]|uniref:AAA family ATPase n=1 Tax=Marinobacter sp. X15-166B TaxID=1897620 RepID=UPI00085CBFF3|nr:AAA family ATPase [Marinobacter sp. X15-166B]OEY67605.1 hypothetical protein BG841_14965 [Marinobacter sp. X15-166B]
MKLQRVRIEQVRQFRQPLELPQLTAGLNLFYGPNESGKSTLVQAIRSAFFERHRSNGAEHLRPWGDSAAAPSIEIHFTSQRQDWQLHKSFLATKRCDLQVAGQAFSGEEAEDKLADLLGFQYASRGASQDRHWGIPGLLWVEQGSGQDIEAAAQHAGDHLQAALHSMLGEVASSGGDDLIQTVAAQRSNLLTPTGKPRGEYATLATRKAELSAGLATLEQRIGQYQAQVDRLGELRQQHQRDEHQQPWLAARQQYEEAQRRHRQVEQWQQEQQQEQQALNNHTQTLGLLREQQSQARSQVDKLEQRHQEYIRAQESLASLSAQSPQIEARLQHAQSAYSRALEKVALARQQQQHGQLADSVSQLERQIAGLSDRLAKAREHQETLEQTRQVQRQDAIDPDTLANLRQCQRQLDEASIRSNAIATRLRYHLEGNQTFTLEDTLLRGTGETLLLEETRLVIPGVGELQITPGGEDLGRLQRQLARLTDERNRQLHALAVASLAEGEQKAERQAERLRTIKTREQLLTSVAPEGIDALRAHQQTEYIRLEQLRARLAALPVASATALPLDQAETQQAEREQQLADAEQQHQRHQQSLAMATQRTQAAQQEWQQLQRELEDPKRQQLQHTLAQNIRSAEEDSSRLQAAIDLRQTRIDEARPDLLQQDMVRFKTSAEQLERAHQSRALELARLQSALETLGGEGLEELRDQQTANLERVERRYQELRRRAEALDLLLGLLQDKRQELTRRLQAPLQKHLHHYLRMLFPQASIEVDDRLIPGQMTRSGRQGQETGEVRALSFGAREQMGLISRLAYADLLQEAGRPTLIILDDTLVHSDVTRLAKMKRILFDASQRHQILLFTCHPDQWQDLGVQPRDLEAIKSQALSEVAVQSPHSTRSPTTMP